MRAIMPTRRTPGRRGKKQEDTAKAAAGNPFAMMATLIHQPLRGCPRIAHYRITPVKCDPLGI